MWCQQLAREGWWSETRRNQKGSGRVSLIIRARSCRKASAIFRRISLKRLWIFHNLIITTKQQPPLEELNGCRDKCRPETNARAGPLTLQRGRVGGWTGVARARSSSHAFRSSRCIRSAVRARAASPWILYYTRGAIIYINDFSAFQLPSIRPVSVCLTFDQ